MRTYTKEEVLNILDDFARKCVDKMETEIYTDFNELGEALEYVYKTLDLDDLIEILNEEKEDIRCFQ